MLSRYTFFIQYARAGTYQMLRQWLEQPQVYSPQTMSSIIYTLSVGIGKIEPLFHHPETEFVQIQLNYADWNNPVVRSGQLYEILRRRNIPMIIMEPIKGGTLANLAPELEAKYKAMRPDTSAKSIGRETF